MRRVQGRKTRGRVGRRYGHGRRQRQRTAGVGVDVGRTARPGKSPFADRDCPDQCIQIHSQSEPSTKHSASPFFLSRNTLSFQWIHSDVIPIVASPSQTPAPAAQPEPRSREPTSIDGRPHKIPGIPPSASPPRLRPPFANSTLLSQALLLPLDLTYLLNTYL